MGDEQIPEITEQDLAAYPMSGVLRWCPTHQVCEMRKGNSMPGVVDTPVDDLIEALREASVYPARPTWGETPRRFCDPRVNLEESYGEPEMVVTGWVPVDKRTARSFWQNRKHWEARVRKQEEEQVAALRKKRPDLFTP